MFRRMGKAMSCYWQRKSPNDSYDNHQADISSPTSAYFIGAALKASKAFEDNKQAECKNENDVIEESEFFGHCVVRLDAAHPAKPKRRRLVPWADQSYGPRLAFSRRAGGNGRLGGLLVSALPTDDPDADR